MFVYVIWISSKGEALPVYPWRDWKWTARPAGEEPEQHVYLPAIDKTFVMDVGEPGMETLMLLARNTPLPADVDLNALLSGLPPQVKEPDDAAVWSENGRIVTDDPAGPRRRWMPRRRRIR